MTDWALPPITYIEHDDALRQLVTTLAREPLLAVDTESNSLHAYREQVCLFQLSTRTADYIIDPLAIDDMQPFGALLANPAIEKVFHAAEYDLACMKRDYGFVVNNLFDTMVSARICGRKAVGLSALLIEYVGVKPDKSHQRDDWRRRPLSSDSLRYAQMDTHFLPLLRDKLYAELEQGAHLPEARELFDEVCQATPANGRHVDPDGYRAIGQPHDLNRRQMAILRELYLLRERLAEERDFPPFKVFSNATMVALACADPTTMDALEDIEGMSPAQIRRYGRQLLRTIELGRSSRLPPPPKPIAPDPVASDLYTVLHNWRRGRAEQRGVESDVIISKHALWELARRAPSTLDQMRDIRGLGPWRTQTYGTEILDVIASYNNNGA
jgi:ribonuclease D